MSDQEWLEWTGHHKTLFALRTDADAEMVGSWRDLLGHVSAVDLHAASQELLKAGGVPYSRHVASLLRLVADRVRLRAQAWESRDRNVTCKTCNDRGLVDVPHPGCVVDGDLVDFSPFGGRRYLATIVVYCDCNVGAHKHQQMTDAVKERKERNPRVPCTLVWYEQNICPHWRILAEELAVRRRQRYADLEKASWRPLAETYRPLIGKIKHLKPSVLEQQ